MQSATARLACATFLAAAIIAHGARAQAQSPKTWSRDSITGRIADLRRIHTPEGIEILEQVDISGTKQWVSIRGLNKANPVLLMIHGGPGSPVMGMSWAFQKPWEDFFTVVQYDQRGMGKNFLSTDTTAVAPTMTVDRLTQDAEEVVAYLRRKLNKEKVVVLGFSFGSTLGTRLAAAKPEWLHAYVGVGQSASGGERYLYERVVAVATALNDTMALRELKSIAPYPPATGFDLDKALLARKYARMYDGGWYGKDDFNLYFALPEWGPEYTQADVDAHLPALKWAERHVMMGGRTSGTGPNRPTGRDGVFRVPIILAMGRYDLHTPYEGARIWFEKVSAPNKKFITFERSSHFPMFEEPGRFLAMLINDVLPLTGEAATFTRPP
ncbi:MAG: alpha/beta fold hydrolase [Gemmatimonadaceae bacterium]